MCFWQAVKSSLVRATPIYDATNGLVTAVAKCGLDGICQ